MSAVTTAVPPSVSDRHVPAPNRRVTWAATDTADDGADRAAEADHGEQQRSDVEHLLGEQHERRRR